MAPGREVVAWLRRNPVAADAALAAGLGLIAQVEIWLTGSVSGSKPVAAGAALVITGALVWRRRAPLVAAAVAGSAYILQSLALGYIDGAISVIVALLVVLYSVAAYEQIGRAVAGGALVLAAAWVSVARHSDSTVGDYFFSALVLGTAWTFGAVIRSRRRYAVGLEDRAIILEHERDHQARVAVADERARIARELHDVVAHSVGTIVVQAGAERLALGGEAERTRDALLTIENTGRQALAEMRRLLGMLRRDDADLGLAPQPSLAHVDGLLDQVRAAGLSVELEVDRDLAQLPPGVDLSAYRIVQEALTNALKHAGAAHVRVAIRYTEQYIELEVVDDGSGPAMAGTSAGHGIVGMRERVALYGGMLETGARDAGGFAVRARLRIEP
jgi:signal transduction histidine kinase